MKERNYFTHIYNLKHDTVSIIKTQYVKEILPNFEAFPPRMDHKLKKVKNLDPQPYAYQEAD